MLGTKRKTALLGSASAVALLVAGAPVQAQTEVEVSGYVKGDAIYDTSGGTVGDSFAVSNIGMPGTPQHRLGPHFRAHAKQSRFRLKTKSDTAFGDLTTYIEGDFNGQGGNQNVSNSTTFRLRHAYGTLGPLLVGQTWSNFVRFHYGSTVDFYGPQGVVLNRQAQIRYTFDVAPNTTVAVSAENPETFGSYTGAGDGSINSFNGDGVSIDKVPDFVAMIDYNAGGTSISAGGIFRQLYWDSGNTKNACPLPKCEDSATGFGATFGISQQVLGRDSIMGEITYGKGIGRYLNGVMPDAYLKTDGSLDAVKMIGFDATYTHVWSDTAESNVIFGEYHNYDTVGGGDLEQTRSLHANYMWHPVPRVTLGMEYMWGQKKTDGLVAGANDNVGSHNRIQFGAQYRF
jgi:hypothetical protein